MLKKLIRGQITAEFLTNLAIVATTTVASIFVMLRYTSPEFNWDESDYAANVVEKWSFLWRSTEYSRHAHGPMAIYLAKLGRLLPDWTASVEHRWRFPAAVVSSLSIGFSYWALRRCFGTSRAAAVAGSGLLLLSVIRLEETNVIGPHHLMLACTLAVAALGYRWRERPTAWSAVALGAVFGFGALSMAYVIPVALCWVLAMFVAGPGWVEWDRTHITASRLIVVLLATVVAIVALGWPPGVLRLNILRDFLYLVRYPGDPIWVGYAMFPVAPRWSAAYWLLTLDAPLLVASTLVVGVALLKAWKRGSWTSRHSYLLVFLAFFLATALTSPLYGARNLLQLVGVLCLATGALFDEAVGHEPRRIRVLAAAVIALAVVNLARVSRDATYTPYNGTDGYQAFLSQNRHAYGRPVKALVYGMPILRLYAREKGIVPAWNADEVPYFTTISDAPLDPDVQYALIPEFMFEHMAADDPIRAVADHWRVAWSFKTPHAWELRLYEKPAANP